MIRTLLGAEMFTNVSRVLLLLPICTLDMTEILLKGCNTASNPSDHLSICPCTTFHRYPIFSKRYSVLCKVYTGYCGTSEIEHGLCACTVDNPLAKARGLSLRTGAQTMLYLPLNDSNCKRVRPCKVQLHVIVPYSPMQ